MTTIIDRQRAYLSRIVSPQRSSAVLWPASVTPTVGIAEPKLDSYLLALAALPYARGRVLDTFAGSGLVGFTLLAKASSLHFVDINPSAIAHIAKCASTHDRADEISWEVGDVYPAGGGAFDTIVANPPYTDAVARSMVERICFDEQHLASQKFIAGLASRLNADGNAFISWPDYTEQRIAPWCERASLHCETSAEISEPSKVQSPATIRYTVYRIHRR